MASPEQIETFCFAYRETRDLGAAIDAVTSRHPPVRACSPWIRAVCESYRLKPAQLLRDGGRIPARADARHVAIWLLRHAGSSYPAIGEAMGGMHHTSCISAVNRVNRTERLLAQAKYILSEKDL
jgi:hypothetical protein